MLDLESAIKHCEEVMMENLEKTKDRNASDPIAINCFECADEHRQLMEWLKELKAHREAWDGMKEGLLEMSRLYEYVSIKCVISLIDGFRPKEDAE